MSNCNDDTTLSNGIGRMDISEDDGAVSPPNSRGAGEMTTRSQITSSKNKCTSCEQKVKHKTDNSSGGSITDIDIVSNSVDSDIDVSTCANCGREGASNTCNKCKSVKYCYAVCKKKHKTKHKRACERRVAELHDEQLFKRPPQLDDDCPICFLRLPLFNTGRKYKTCCGKFICSGCIHAVQKLDGGVGLCPFCRAPAHKSSKEAIGRTMKRVELNDTQAMSILGTHYSEGVNGLSQDYTKALELFHQAAELGNTDAYSDIGCMYVTGEGVERDEKRAFQFFGLAAIGGDVDARFTIGRFEQSLGSKERAIKHFMIAVEGGHNGSLKMIKQLFIDGKAAKDEYAKALQVYQTYLNEVKSSQRDEAAAYSELYKYIE